MFERGAQMAALGAAVLLSGCAVSYDDGNGVRHVIGLTSTRIVSADKSATLAGDVVTVEAVGVLVSRNAQGDTLSIGYSSLSTAAIRNNALVAGNPIDAVDKIIRSER